MPALDDLAREICLCRKCPALVKSRTLVVPGCGPDDAPILFIGEAPGYNEDQQGLPFVGAAGAFLDELLASIKLKRDEVFITNIIKCRPPENRDPLPTEISNCNPWLESQLGRLKPRMIVTLGRYSLARFFPGKTISKIHGTAQKRNGVIYFAMYHPAAALHQGTLRQTIIEDMARIPGLLAQASKVAEDDQPRQMSMF
ncbi:MAG: uracil-DNA glycosylase [Dehalococcoidia bacterium]|jgi:DNA polymerase|nr:MAG: uracil-DNA glycosylase [Dehalococcoidia bacterium]